MLLGGLLAENDICEGGILLLEPSEEEPIVVVHLEPAEELDVAVGFDVGV